MYIAAQKIRQPFKALINIILSIFHEKLSPKESLWLKEEM